MNILIAPFHDWRKILLEGFRTRDAHFIEELSKNKKNIILLVNRPTTLLEILLKRKRNLIKGKVLKSASGSKLYKVENSFYVIDFVSKNIIGQVFRKYNWFIDEYGNEKHISFIKDCLKYLKIESDYCLLNQNIFAYKLSEKLRPKISVFDAWDNFLKFKIYKRNLKEIELGYNIYGRFTDFWITNSQDNIIDFSKFYKNKKIVIIKNGVDVNRFVEKTNNKIPEDMKNIPKPIVGFGGKITQLIDVDLLNETMILSPSMSFVFVGQKLDKQVFNRIKKLDNFYYLGDKHYDEYPNYVKNFDICIVPYVVEEDSKSGANSIKVYEYLSTNKKVVGTNSNGLEDLTNHLYIANNAKHFAICLKDLKNEKDKINLDEHSWSCKVDEFVRLLNEN